MKFMKRSLPIYLEGQKVSVYRNLSDCCLSVLHKQHVAGHAQAVVLEGVAFHVRESSRQKVLLKKQKNVHAFVKGCLVSVSDQLVETSGAVAVSYNPYRAGHFYIRETGTAVLTASRCVVTTGGVFAWL